MRIDPRRGRLRLSSLARIALAGSALVLSSCEGGGSGTPPPPPPGAIAPGSAIGSASISGRAVLAGSPPARRPFKLTDAGCRHETHEPLLSEEVVASPDGTLRNVIVSVKAGLGSRVFAPPLDPAIMDQKGCVYTPHVLSLQANQIVTFLNSDPTLHNVHAVSKLNPPFNVGMSVLGQKVSRFFSKPEIVRMKCDVHSWMVSYIGVFDHPFHAVTGPEGTFSLEGLPAGTYEIEAWQETYGLLTQTVTLDEGEKSTIEFTFRP